MNDPNCKIKMPVLSNEQFEKALGTFRRAVMNWCAPKMEAYFVAAMNKEYPDLKYKGRPISSFEDFLNFYKAGPNDNKMRAIVYYAISGVWTTNNQWALNFEQEFCEMMNITILDTNAVGDLPEKPSAGKWVAKSCIRRKTAWPNMVREIGQKCWLEAILHRSEKKIKGTIQAAERKERKGIPRILVVRYASKERDGFPGSLALCAGHPSLLKMRENEDFPRIVGSPSAATTVSALTLGTPTERVQLNKEVQDFLAATAAKAKDLEHLQSLLAEHSRAAKSATVVTCSVQAELAASDADDDDFHFEALQPGKPGEPETATASEVPKVTNVSLQ